MEPLPTNETTIPMNPIGVTGNIHSIAKCIPLIKINSITFQNRPIFLSICMCFMVLSLRKYIFRRPFHQ